MKLSVWILTLLFTQSTLAVPVESIHAKYTTPVTPRAGVLMVPLLSEEPGDQWPTTLDVILEDGQKVVGHVGWVEIDTNRRLWSTSPIKIQPIHPTNDTSTIHPKDTTTGPVLLAQLPKSPDGQITIGTNTIEPIWFDIPDALPDLNLTPTDTSVTLQRGNKYTRSLNNPLEYWRVTLIASRNGVLPFEPHNSNIVKSLAAKHGEQIWRVAFDRLARSSRGVAAECRDLLTNVGTDGSTEFACWTTGTETKLLSTLLDKSLTSRQLATRALRWCEEQRPFVYWLEQVYGNDIVIAVSNPTLEAMLVAVQWREGNDIPLAVEIPPRETMRVPIPRVDTLDLSIFGPTTAESSIEWLDLQIDSHVFSIPVVPQTVVARPPSIQLQPLYPKWTLQSIRRQTPNLVPKEFRTIVQLRKLFGKWEFYVSCAGYANQSHVGGETVVFYNPITHNTLNIIPTPLASSSDGWSASIEVPIEWIDNDTLQFSVVRKHGASTFVEEGPIPCIPWRNSYPTPIVVDLSQWDVIDRFPDSR